MDLVSATFIPVEAEGLLYPVDAVGLRKGRGAIFYRLDKSAAGCSRAGTAEGMQFFSAPWPMKQESPPANAEDLLRALKNALNLGQEATPATVLQTLNTLMKTEESTTATKPAEPDVKALSATHVLRKKSWLVSLVPCSAFWASRASSLVGS